MNWRKKILQRNIQGINQQVTTWKWCQSDPFCIIIFMHML